MAKRAVGTKIKINTNYIAEITSIGGLELTADTIDITALDSVGGFRQFTSGFKDAGEVALTGFFNPGDLGQNAMYAAYDTGTTDNYSIIFPSGLGGQWDFQGVVTGFKTTSIDVDSVVGFEATIKVSGKPTLGITASAGLSGLALSGAGGALTPAFSNTNYEYTYDGVTATSVTITATAATQTIKLFIDGTYSQDLTSGAASAAIPLTLNVGKKLTVFANEDGKAQKMYEVVVVKTA